MARVVRPSWSGTDFFYTPRIGKGQVLFTGPDGIRDHRVTTLAPNKSIGIGAMSPEGTGDTHYLFRPAQRCPHPVSKHRRVGEIGWGLQMLHDRRQRAQPRYSIKLLEFRQACEDRYRNLYQNPPYPGTKIIELQEQAEQKCSRYPHHFDNVLEESFQRIEPRRSQTPMPPKAARLYKPDFERPQSAIPAENRSRRSDSRSSGSSSGQSQGRHVRSPQRSSVSSGSRDRSYQFKAWEPE